jgi:hypothetical protein
VSSPKNPYFEAMQRVSAVSKAEMQARASVNTPKVATELATGGEMQATINKTIVLPQVFEREPIAVARATARPCRVVVKNISATTVNLGFSAQDVQSPDGPGTDIFVLLPGDQDVLVLAPGQVLFANGAGPGTRITVSVSEAFPFL